MNYEIITLDNLESEADFFLLKVRSEFADKETGEPVKLVRYFKFPSTTNLPNLKVWLALQDPTWLTKNITDKLVIKGKCEAFSPAELENDI
jgi:hypothetical protein